MLKGIRYPLGAMRTDVQWEVTVVNRVVRVDFLSHGGVYRKHSERK
jgi:hypothetical protein